MLRVKTGVTGLDKLIEGGFLSGSSLVLIGPPGCGKSTLSQQFIYQGLKENQPALYVTLDIPPSEVISIMKGFGWRVPKKSPILKFIDAYSWRIGGGEEEYTISNLGNVNELNIMISEVIKVLNSSEIKRQVFDSVSTLLLYADPKLVVKLMPVIIAKFKKAGYTQLLILEEGVHDKRTVSTLNYISDGLIEFKMEEDKRLLRIVRMKGTKHKRNWVEFDVTNRGIKL